MSQRVWLLVRGLGRSQEHWLDFPQLLQKEFPQDLILHVDLPGNGVFFQQVSPTHIHEYADHLRNEWLLFKSKLSNSEVNLSVIAMSLGAMAVVNWMQRYPKDIHRSYLINTSCANFVGLTSRLRPQMLWQFTKIAIAKEPQRREQTILEMVSQSRERQTALLPTLTQISEKQPVTMKNLLRQLFAASQAQFPLTKPGEIKLIGSPNDQMVSQKASKNIASAWNLEVLWHPWAGHDIPFDDPEWLVSKLKSFSL